MTLLENPKQREVLTETLMVVVRRNWLWATPAFYFRHLPTSFAPTVKPPATKAPRTAIKSSRA
jgi:hypothetical protein